MEKSKGYVYSGYDIPNIEAANELAERMNDLFNSPNEVVEGLNRLNEKCWWIHTPTINVEDLYHIHFICGFLDCFKWMAGAHLTIKTSDYVKDHSEPPKKDKLAHQELDQISKSRYCSF